MIKSVFRCPNDLVIVLDENGEQIPEYQGYYNDVKESILRDTSSDTVFSYFYDTEPRFKIVLREDW